MSKLSKFRNLAVSMLSGLALTVGTGNAQAAVDSIDDLSLVAGLQCVIGTHYMTHVAGPATHEEHVMRCKFTTVPGVPLTWAAGEEGDAVLLEPGFTTGTCLVAGTLVDPLPYMTGVSAANGGNGANCVSDVVRFVNVAGEAEIWFISDGAADDVASMPALPVGFRPIDVGNEFLPPLSHLNIKLTARKATNGRFYSISIGSDLPTVDPTKSDVLNVALAVPAVSPFGLAGMGIILLGFAAAFLHLQQRRGLSLIG